MLAHPAHVDPVAALGQHVAHALFGRKQAALLVNHHPVQRLGKGYRAVIGGQFTGQQLEQGGLARAIGSDQTDPVTTLDAQREVLDYGPLTKALGNFLGNDDRLGLNVINGQFHLGCALRAEHGGALGAHFPELFEPSLVALAPRGDAAFQPVRLDLQLGIQLFSGPRFLGIDLFHPGFVTAKADFLAAQRSAIEPDRCLGQAFQKGPVVADHHESASIATQPAFQPVDGGQVEVVGRLVQQQQVGLAGQRAGEGGAAAFSTAGALGLACHVDAQLPGDRLNFVLGRGILAVQGKVHQRFVTGEERILLQRHDLDARLD